MISSRGLRFETRNRVRDEIKKTMLPSSKVRKCKNLTNLYREKRWVELGLANSLKVYKWIPVKEEQPEDDKDIKQQEIQPVITTSGNESAEIVIDSGNTTIQSESIQDLIKPSNSLPTDILANGDMKGILTDSNGSENAVVTQNSAASEEVHIKQNSPTDSNNEIEQRAGRSSSQLPPTNRDRSRSPH